VTGAVEATDDTAEAQLPALEHRSRTILVVEDEAPLRDLIVRILRGEGYTVLHAEAPESALRIARDHEGEIHLLVTDVVMPGASGAEFAEQLRVGRPAIEVLFISGYASDDLLRRGISEAEAPFLAKPFMPDELTSMVREVLDREPDERDQDAAGAA
jgi:CheY-like chemotaxis protein